MEAYINETGITTSVSEISINICEKNNFYIDLLLDGKCVVSKHNTKIGIFTDIEKAMFYFMSKSNPQQPLTKIEEEEALEYLKSFLIN